jgi:hypothetical protein
MEKTSQFINITGTNIALYPIEKKDGTLLTTLRKIRFNKKELSNEWISYFMTVKVPQSMPLTKGKKLIVNVTKSFLSITKFKLIEPILVILENGYEIIKEEEFKAFDGFKTAKATSSEELEKARQKAQLQPVDDDSMPF